ncbi:MAG: carboxymuconolactone decarboxylase family protein [Armatimonadota bacterium]
MLKIRRDFRTAGLPEDDVAMLEFAELLTLDPSRVKEDHIDRLRKAGFTDVEIFDIVLLTAYRNFMVRISSGLNVKLDQPLAELDEGYRQALMTGA